MTVWFSADHHFGHKRIIELCRRPFDSVEEMNETLVKNHNSLVAKDDEVWLLGDIVMGDQSNLDYLRQINGYKILVVGNHDKNFGKPEKDKLYEDVGVKEIYHDYVDGWIIGGERVTVSHFPYFGDSHDNDRFEDNRPTDRGEWLLHGHVHDQWLLYDRQINVGVDAWAGYPVSTGQIEILIKQVRFEEVMDW